VIITGVLVSLVVVGLLAAVVVLDARVRALVKRLDGLHQQMGNVVVWCEAQESQDDSLLAWMGDVEGQLRQLEQRLGQLEQHRETVLVPHDN
jgi:hypothetical protein